MQVSLKQRLGAFAAAGALALAMAPMAAFGDPEEPTPSDPPATPAAGTLSYDSTLTVSGLKNASDTPTYYQVLEYDATQPQGWKLATGFTGIEAQIKALNPPQGTETPKSAVECLLDGINGAEAGVIAQAAKNATAKGTMAVSADKVATVSPAASGLYLVLVTPADNNVVYAPMFVSADYKSDNTTNTLAANTASLAEPDMAVAKITELDVTKKSTGSTLDNNEDAGVDTEAEHKNTSLAAGSKVNFQVSTNVPSYTKNVTNAQFIVSDKVSTGLTIDTTKVVVQVGSDATKKATVSAGGFYKVNGEAGTSSAYDYKVSTLSGTEWKIEFSNTYLTTVATGNPPVLVTYEAEVAASDFNVNQMKNTAKIEYTHLPDGTTASKTDDTHHYTYSLDGNLNGTATTEDVTKELVKVGVDQDDNPIVTGDVTKVNSRTVTNALAGATFKLTATNSEQEYTATSAADGTITFNGLDAGEYTLEETSAPAGWVMDSARYKVEIIPTFETDSDGCYVLKSYAVKITNMTTNSTVTSNFTMTYTDNEGEVVMTSSDGDLATMIKNTRAGLLPSTGGDGIFFYVFVGAAIMALAVVLARRYRNSGRKAQAGVA